MDFREKFAEFLEWTIPIWWGFVVGVGFAMAFFAGVDYNSVIFFKISIKIFLWIICGIFFIIGFFIRDGFIKRCFFIISTFSLGIYIYFNSVDYSSPYHLTAKVEGSEKYKYLDTNLNETTIIYGTIVADPDIRENFTYIIVQPDKIVPELNKISMQLDETIISSGGFVKEKDFVKDIEGDVIITKNNVRIKLASVNTKNSDINLLNKFLKEKILKKEVIFIIEETFPQDKYGNIFAFIKLGDELINSSVLENNLAKFYEVKNKKFVKKIVSGEVIQLSGKTGLIRARVSPEIGDYYVQMGYGDYVKITTSLTIPKNATNPAGFDFRRYLNARGIFAVTKTLREPQDIEYLGVSDKANFLTRFSFAVRQRLLLTIRKTVPYPQSAFLGGVALGYRGGVPQKIREEFQSTGVAHVLALSGLHTGFIAVLLLIFCNLFRIKSVFRFLVVSIGLLLFVIMTGSSPSTTRAALMYCLGLFFFDVLKLNLNKSTRITIVIAAVIILLRSPLLLVDASFVLSFMAVWSLIYVGPATEKLMIRTESRFIHQFITFPLFTMISGMTLISLFGGILKEMSLVKKFFPVLTKIGYLEMYFPKWFNNPNFTWLSKGEFALVSLTLYLCGVIVSQIYYMSGKSIVKDMNRSSLIRGLLQFVSAQVAINIGMMWPLSSVYFYRFPIAGFYANFLAIPLIGVNVQLAWIAALIDIFFSFIGLGKIGLNLALLIGAFNDQMSQMFLGIAKTWANFVPYPYMDMFTEKYLVLWYGIVIIMIYLVKYSDLLKQFWAENKRLVLSVFSIILLIIIFYVKYYIFPSEQSKNLQVICFDVSFGNSVLVRTPTKNILIDTGPPGPPGWAPVESALSPSFTKFRVKKFDDVIITSLKPQTIGGLKHILKYFPTKNLYLPNNFSNITTESYYGFLEKMNLWYALSNPYNYEYTGLFLANYVIYNEIKRYKGKYEIVSQTKVLYDENINGTNFKLEIISPRPVKNTLDEIGNSSYFVKITYGNTSLLYLGQIGYDLQNSLLTYDEEILRSKIVVMPQNGNYNSFNEQFIKKINPEVVLIQYGWTNQRIGYFMPTLVYPTVKRLEELGIKVYRTDYTGAVLININKDGYKIDTIISEQEYKVKYEFDREIY